MYLSRLTLNPRSRQIRRDLADLHQLHRTIMSGFPDTDDAAARHAHGVLYRLEPLTDGPPKLLVQSSTEPAWQLDDHLLPGTAIETKDIGPFISALAVGDRLRFRMLANPTRKVARHTPDGDRRRQGRRVELRTDAQQRDWLARQATRHGFQIPTTEGGDLDVLITGLGRHSGRRPSPDSAPVIAVGALYEGHLDITDLEAFRKVMRDGIGPAKAYGYGLLSVARV